MYTDVMNLKAKLSLWMICSLANTIALILFAFFLSAVKNAQPI